MEIKSILKINSQEDVWMPFMLGWCVVAERIVIWVLPNLGMGDHTLVFMLDGVGCRLGSLRSFSSGNLMCDMLRWSF